MLYVWGTTRVLPGITASVPAPLPYCPWQYPARPAKPRDSTAFLDLDDGPALLAHYCFRAGCPIPALFIDDPLVVLPLFFANTGLHGFCSGCSRGSSGSEPTLLGCGCPTLGAIGVQPPTFR